MIKLSSRMLYKKKDHTKLFFNGMQHEKMYKNGQLIWERGIGKKYIIVRSNYDFMYLIYIDTEEYENIGNNFFYTSSYNIKERIFYRADLVDTELSNLILCNSKMCFLHWYKSEIQGKYNKQIALGMRSKNGKQWKIISIDNNYGYHPYSIVEFEEALYKCDNKNHFIAPFFVESTGNKKLLSIMLFNINTNDCHEVLLDNYQGYDGYQKYEYMEVYSDNEYISFARKNIDDRYDKNTIIMCLCNINDDDLSKAYWRGATYEPKDSWYTFVCAIVFKKTIFVLWYNDEMKCTYETIYNMDDGTIISKGKSNLDIILRGYSNIYTGLYALNKVYLYVHPYMSDKVYVIETEDGISFKKTELPETVKVHDIKSGETKELNVAITLNQSRKNITSDSNLYFENNELKGNKGHLILTKPRMKRVIYIDNMYFNESKNNFMFEVSDTEEQ